MNRFSKIKLQRSPDLASKQARHIAYHPLRAFLFALSAFLLTGCMSAKTNTATALVFNDTLSSSAQRSRIDVIVLHYTASSAPIAKQTLTEKEVSSHYLVTDDNPPVIYRLVNETQSAWHAGDSSWFGRTYLNSSSIGIEIVHPGWTKNAVGDPGPPYPTEQIAVITALIKDIAARHGVAPENIVGHSDIAPLRKQDPGPAFPWRALASAGVGRWFDETAAQKYVLEFQKNGPPDINWFQKQLKRVGYDVPDTGALDKKTTAALTAFQLHFRARSVSGLPDSETAAVLLALPSKGSAWPN
jgi:N-acetylmuramoyl-L-alanine amidase